MAVDKIPKEYVSPGQVWTAPGTEIKIFITSTRSGWWSGFSTDSNGRLISDKIRKDSKGNEHVGNLIFSHAETSLPSWAK